MFREAGVAGRVQRGNSKGHCHHGLWFRQGFAGYTVSFTFPVMGDGAGKRREKSSFSRRPR